MMSKNSLLHLKEWTPVVLVGAALLLSISSFAGDMDSIIPVKKESEKKLALEAQTGHSATGDIGLFSNTNPEPVVAPNAGSIHLSSESSHQN